MKKRVKKVLIIEPRRAFSSLEAFVFYMVMRSLRFIYLLSYINRCHHEHRRF
jgi:hypothetical protein